MSKPAMPARRVAPAVLRYGLPVFSVAIALSATLLLHGYTFRTPLFFPAIMLSTWFGGTGPGLLTVVLSTLSVNYFFLDPTFSLAFGFHDLPHLIVFLLSAVLVSSWSAARRRAEEALRRARDELQAKVQVRTADLSRRNKQLRIEIAERERVHAEREQWLTREQAAHAEAVAAQQRFRALVNSIEGIVWEADAQTLQFLFISQQAQRILGYPVERWLNEPTFWKDHLHADDREWAVDFCLAATAAKRDHDFEYRMIGTAGRSVWLRDIVTVVVEGDRATKLRGVMVDITERKRAEEALREQASLLNLTHDTVFVRDRNDVITYWNRGAEELYGWRWEEAVGTVTHQLMQTIFPAPLEEINAELLRTDRWEGELIHTRRDGTQVIVASRWSLQRDDYGRPTAILETNNDITERKQAEEALRRSEEQWRAVFEFNPTMYFMVDAAGTVLAVNLFGAEQLGYTVEELVGRSVLHVFYEPDREAVQRNVALCLQHYGPAMSWEVRKVRKDGTVLWVRETAKAMRRAKSDPVVLIVCEDITQRKRVEETLRESEERFRRMAETIPEVIWIMALEPEKMLYVSPSYERIWGLPAEDLYRDSRLWLTSVHPDDRARATSVLTRWLEDAGGSKYDIEFRIVQPNGTIRWIHDRGVLMQNEQGKAYRAHGIAEDITERKRAEEALQNAQAELARMARLTMMGELAASITHEINQPLGAVVNNASACVRWLAAQNLEEARQSALRVVADGHRAGEIIGRMRALAKKAPPHKDWLDLNATIRDVLALARSEVHRHRVVVETHLAAAVLRIRGDRIQLQQVLLNLVMNAIEALSGVGAGPRVLRVSSESVAATEVVVAVCDSGPGFEPQHVERLFEAFYTTKPHGLGLGLAISRRIIEAHGGRLWATANVPHGAVVQFTVPTGGEEGT